MVEARRPAVCDRCGENDQYVLVAVKLGEGMLLTHVPRNRLYTPTTYIFILWMVGSSLVLLCVAGGFPAQSGKVAAAAGGRRRRVRQRASGRLHKVEGALEVRQAAVAFIRMRDRIQRQIRQRTEMLAGVSHDLRTPLTRMKLALELIGDDPASAELKSDVAEMERLVHGYLDFARGEGTEIPVETDIGLLIEDLAAAARRDGTPLTVGAGARTGVAGPAECAAALPRQPDRQRAPLWTACLAVTVPADDGIDILVDDDGPGIPESERERVFRPFIRLDASRNPATGGVGLGLTIARDMARSHGGDVRLETSP